MELFSPKLTKDLVEAQGVPAISSPSDPGNNKMGLIPAGNKLETALSHIENMLPSITSAINGIYDYAQGGAFDGRSADLLESFLGGQKPLMKAVQEIDAAYAEIRDIMGSDFR